MCPLWLPLMARMFTWVFCSNVCLAFQQISRGVLAEAGHKACRRYMPCMWHRTCFGQCTEPGMHPFHKVHSRGCWRGWLAGSNIALLMWLG